MGVLAPIFLAGLAALSLPLIFHLVRRIPQGRQEFSSLMFLAPTPPKLTRRSRLDQILLLLLRLTALSLLVFAFSRPFIRKAASLTFGDLPSRRVALLIDTSASMRRGDLWTKAIKTARDTIQELNPQDDVALYTFADRLKPVLPFASSIGADKAGADTVSAVEDRRQIAEQLLAELRPTWSDTDLGQALVAVAQELDATTDVQQVAGQPEIFAISDFQFGANLDALQGYEWPKRIRVVPKLLAPSRSTNAYARVLYSDEDRDSRETRVRVVNAANSATDQFSIGFLDEKRLNEEQKGIPVYVPAGQSRVVRLSRGERQLQADRIVLTGDDHDFDNTFHVVPLTRLPVKIDYFGNDGLDDPQGLAYYLKLAVADDPLRQVDVVSVDPANWPVNSAAAPVAGQSQKSVRLAVVSRSVDERQTELLWTFVKQGGTLVLVPEDQESARVVPRFFEDVTLPDNSAQSTARNDYRLLGEIDFAHPIFLSLASARYSDFTKIRFWRDRGFRLGDSPTSRVVARFDHGAVAILERNLGSGRVLVFGSGWSPDESQLALSSKFVAMVAGLLDLAGAVVPNAAGHTVNESVSLKGITLPCEVIAPDGRRIEVPSTAKTFERTDTPGIYRVRSGLFESQVAVNLATTESNTAPMNMEQLDQLGVKIGAGESRAERLDRVRQLRDVELERQQKGWRWLLVGTIAVLIWETGLAGRATRKAREDLENQQ